VYARSLRSLAVLGLASLIVACGGAAAPARSPETAPTSTGGAAPEPSARVNQDERALEGGSIGRAQADFDDASRAVELAGNDCAQLCKALASMSNATERLCALANGGTDDDRRRCTDARAKLEAARSRVREKCPACEPS
jgi:hypothetical protein